MRRRLSWWVPIALVVTMVVGMGSAQAATSRHKKKTDPYGGFALLLKARQPATSSSGTASSSSSAGTSFTVPTITCGASETSGVIAGSGVFSSVSGWVSAGGIVVGCQSGVATYAAEAVINNTPSDLDLSPVPGDMISTSVVIVPGETQVVVDDVTQDLSATTSQAVGMVGTYISNGIDAERTPAVLPVPNFGVMTFSNTSIDGRTVKAAHGKAINRVTAGVLQIKTGKLNKAGNQYTETFVHS
jgi:hypothetical protein